MAIESLEGKVAFISGASRGIGAALATRFADAGMSLILCSRSAPALDDSERVLARSLDVRDEEAVEALCAEAEDRFGTIDLWINNAGQLDPIAPAREVSVADFRAHIDTNVTGVFIGSKCYVGHLRRRGAGGSVPEGVLINVASGASWKPYAGWVAYCAGKAAVERMTEVIALEEAEIGLRAYSVAPGVVDTAMQTLIRATPEEKFPDAPRFHERKRTNRFNSEDFVTDAFLAIAFDPDRRPDTVAVRVPDEPQ